MRALAGIVRVSHMGDRKAGSETFHADADQVAEVERYATTHGAEVVFLPPELGMSGGLPIRQRPSLKAAIEGVEAGIYAGIVVANLKRLTRSRSGIEIWDRVEAAGGRVHCALENLDTSTPNGRFVRDIHLADAVREREEHTERFEARRENATRAGIWQRRQTPRGYVRDPNTRRLAPERPAEVRDAFRDYLAGTPITHLADRLLMTPSGVRQLLRNRVYLGELRVGGHVNTAAHPAIISRDTFEAVQARLARNARPPRRRVGPALLAGICRCASCGHVMSRGSSRGDAYICPRQHTGGPCPAPATIRCSRLDPVAERVALAELDQLEVVTDSGTRLAAAQSAVTDAEAELAAYLEAVSPQDVGAAAFNRAARARRQTVDDAVRALHRELDRRPPMAVVGSGANVWPDLDGHHRNALLRSLFEAVVVRPAGRGKRVPVPDRVRVIRYGADIVPGRANGVSALPFPDPDDEAVLPFPAVEDCAQRQRGVR